MHLFNKKPVIPYQAVKTIASLLFISRRKAKNMLLTGKYGAADILDVKLSEGIWGKLTTAGAKGKLATADENGNLTKLGKAILATERKLEINSIPVVLVLKDDDGNVKGVAGFSNISISQVKIKPKGHSTGTFSPSFWLN